MSSAQIESALVHGDLGGVPLIEENRFTYAQIDEVESAGRLGEVES